MLGETPPLKPKTLPDIMSGAEIAQAELAKNARREIFVLSFFIVILLLKVV